MENKGCESVSSKIEITDKTGKKLTRKRAVKELSISAAMKAYHSNIRGMGVKVFDYALTLSPDNLLNVKIAIMDAARLVELRMKEMRDE